MEESEKLPGIRSRTPWLVRSGGLSDCRSPVVEC